MEYITGVCVRSVLIDVYLIRGSRDFSEGSADIHRREVQALILLTAMKEKRAEGAEK